ncbi:MAG: glycosyltransferase [Aerococcaceae bacterium]|nr:glycosyltransferase [Aerococcaceae bacterium]
MATTYLRADGSLGLYGIVLLIYLFSKMILSFLYRPFIGLAKDYKVAVVIPTYNEDGEGLIDTLISVIHQDYPIAEIFIVDDGSSDTTGFDKVKQFVADNAEMCHHVVLHRLEQNAGKRHAQSWAFERSDADVFMTVDSDSYIYPDALRELLKAFNDKEVYAVTGHINARNRDDNLLSRLIDIRYDNAFRVERAAQSVTGNILVCSGPMSAYRREVIIPNLERYKNQTFLGVKVNIGDDRCLTNYAIALGKTAYQSTAFCRTDVPTEIGVFIRQQIRWNKSFFRETLEALKLSWKKPFVGIWSTLELVLWLLLIFSQVQFLIGNFNHFNLKYVFYAFLAVVLSALLRNVHYAVKHPWLFLLSPLYGVLHIFLLQPIRLYALLTMKDVRWGTRKK